MFRIKIETTFVAGLYLWSATVAVFNSDTFFQDRSSAIKVTNCYFVCIYQ